MVILALALIAAWLIWSGLYTPLLLGLGALSVGLTLVLALRMRLFRKSVFALDLVPRMFGFWASLLIDIVRSNIQVARIVLSPKLPTAPVLVKLEPKGLGPIGQATLANSITLSPGTITIDSEQHQMLVHCVDAVSADDLRKSSCADRVNQIMGGR